MFWPDFCTFITEESSIQPWRYWRFPRSTGHGSPAPYHTITPFSTLQSLPPIREGYEGIVKSIMADMVTAIIMVMTTGTLYAFGDGACMVLNLCNHVPIGSSFKMATWNVQNRHTHQSSWFADIQNDLGTFLISSHISNQTETDRKPWHQWHSNNTHMQMLKIPTPGLEPSQQTYDNDHIIRLPSQGLVLIWTDNDLKHVDPREPHQIQFLSHILVNIMVIQQNTEQATGSWLMMGSAPIWDDPPSCKPRYDAQVTSCAMNIFYGTLFI